MELSLSPEDLAFRDEVRRFLDENLSEDLREAGRKRGSWIQECHSSTAWQKVLHKKGWAAPTWPVEYGGTGWTAMQRVIFENECSLADAPLLLPTGLRMCGPMLIGKGNAEQKAYFLPRILAAETVWCQGYSEPGAGSDLASLQTRAVADGDDYIINGSKIWTTFAHHADWMFCLVRTDTECKPQEGISFILIDMSTPGIEVRPIINIAGEHEFNQVTFSDTRVPRKNLVGEENEGWGVAKYLLQFERFKVFAPEARMLLRRIKQSAAVTPVDGRLLSDDARFAHKLASLETEVDALRINEMRAVAAMSAGQSPGTASSMFMALQGDIAQRVTELGIETAAYPGMVFQPDALVPGANIETVGPEAAATLLPIYFNFRMRTIAGGTAQVQRNIIAKQVLGL